VLEQVARLSGHFANRLGGGGREGGGVFFFFWKSAAPGSKDFLESHKTLREVY